MRHSCYRIYTKMSNQTTKTYYTRKEAEKKSTTCLNVQSHNPIRAIGP